MHQIWTDGKSIVQLAKEAHLGPVCVIRGRKCPSRGIRVEWNVTLGIWVHPKPRVGVGTFLEGINCVMIPFGSKKEIDLNHGFDNMGLNFLLTWSGGRGGRKIGGCEVRLSEMLGTGFCFFEKARNKT